MTRGTIENRLPGRSMFIAGTARAGAETLTPIITGPAAGATFGGPAGFVIGLGVCLTIAIATGNDRTVGDLAEDVGEWPWFRIEGIFS